MCRPKKYIALATIEPFYALVGVDDRQFEILRAEPDACGLIDGYHPSYTFRFAKKKEKILKKLQEWLMPPRER